MSHFTSPVRSLVAASIVLVFVTGLSACSARTAEIQSEPVSTVPTAADFYGTYDIYFGNAPEGAPALHAVWSAEDFRVSQTPGGANVVRTDMAIDPATATQGTLRIWDANSSRPLCSAEGLYDYTDDGTRLTLMLVTDPCVNRAASADGARLVRQAASQS